MKKVIFEDRFIDWWKDVSGVWELWGEAPHPARAPHPWQERGRWWRAGGNARWLHILS